MEKIKVFVDTNIIFSAIYNNLQGSYPSLILKSGFEEIFNIYISELVEIELRKNVKKKLKEKNKS